MSDCTSCGPSGRRDFLRSVTAALSVAFGSLAISPREAAALPLSLLPALRRSGDDVIYPVPDVDGVTIDDKNEVILVRWQAQVYAFNLSCPHQNTALRWLGKDRRFQCPKHKSKYQPDGTFISGRATRNLDRFAIRKEAGKLVVDVAAMYKSDKQAAAWAAAKVAV